MPQTKRKFGKKYFKRGRRRQQFGKKGVKPTFRAQKAYGVKPDPFPRVLHTRCKYVDSGQLLGNGSSGGYTGGELVYHLNSIYDPYTGVGGTTVVGWSTFDSIYKRYLVMGAKVEITFFDPDQDGVICYASLNRDANLINKADSRIMEQMLTYSSELNNTGSQKKKMSFYVKPWSHLGISKLEFLANKSTYTSLMANSPVDSVSLRIAVSGPNTSGAVPSIRYALRIIYFVEFYDRKQLLSV